MDGKERKLAKAGGGTKVHLLGAVTHVTGLVIGQDKVAKAGKANEITHFRPLLEPLPLAGVVITADAMQAQREHARWLTEDKDAFYLVPVLGNQPGLYAQLDALAWEDTPVAAATTEVSRGRIETRTIRVLPAPEGTAFPYARQAILIERYVTIKKNGRWVMRNCEAVLYVTSLDAAQASPADLLAYVRGHWNVEHLHWLRDVVSARGQIPHPDRERPPGDVRPHQPGHHPLPATGSNRDHRRDTPQRPESPSATPATRPPTRLNRPQDFDESLNNEQPFR